MIKAPHLWRVGVNYALKKTLAVKRENFNRRSALAEMFVAAGGDLA
jgi:hypothetical protein